MKPDTRDIRRKLRLRVCTIKILIQFCFTLFTLVKFIQYFLLAVLSTFLHFKSQSLSKSLHRSLLLELSFHNSVIFIFCHFSHPFKILNNVLSIWFSSFLPFYYSAIGKSLSKEWIAKEKNVRIDRLCCAKFWNGFTLRNSEHAYTWCTTDWPIDCFLRFINANFSYPYFKLFFFCKWILH